MMSEGVPETVACLVANLGLLRSATDQYDNDAYPRNPDRIIGALTKGSFDSAQIRGLVADRAELLGMDAAGNQEAVEPSAGRTGNVSAQAIADGQDLRAVLDAEKAETSIVDRTKRLAVPAHATAGLLVPLRQCAGAEREPAAVHDNKIRIRADHREIAVERPPQQRRIILYLVIPSGRTGIQDELSLCGRIDKFEGKPLANFHVALGTDVQAPTTERGIKRIVASTEVLPRLLARRHHVMVEPGRHPDTCDSLDNVIGSPGCVRQQNDSLASLH